MASTGKLEQARKLLLALEANQSQGSLLSQAIDCAPIVESLGYYDLADHLRRMDSSSVTGPTADGHLVDEEFVRRVDEALRARNFTLDRRKEISLMLHRAAGCCLEVKG